MFSKRPPPALEEGINGVNSQPPPLGSGRDSGGISTQLQHCCPAQAKEHRAMTTSGCREPGGVLNKSSTYWSQSSFPAPREGSQIPWCHSSLADAAISQGKRCGTDMRGPLLGTTESLETTGKMAEWKGHRLWADLGSHSGSIFDHLGSFKHLVPALCLCLHLYKWPSCCLSCRLTVNSRVYTCKMLGWHWLHLEAVLNSKS